MLAKRANMQTSGGNANSRQPNVLTNIVAMQGDRANLLQLLTSYQLPVTGHEGYPKVLFFLFSSFFFVSVPLCVPFSVFLVLSFFAKVCSGL